MIGPRMLVWIDVRRSAIARFPPKAKGVATTMIQAALNLRPTRTRYERNITSLSLQPDRESDWPLQMARVWRLQQP